LLFVGLILAFFVIVVPLLWKQMQGLIGLLPAVLNLLQDSVSELAASYPQYITETQISSLIDQAAGELGNLSATVFQTAFSQVFSLLGLVLYLVLVPISIFFFLKDKDELLAWLHSLLPADRPLLTSVASEMNIQLGNYVRGKAIEIVIVGAATFVSFTILGVNYAALLSVLVGLSVLIPFVGAAVVTLPVFIVGVIQFGWSWELGTVMIVYGVIQFLDGNVLVPLLFSEVVDLHPISIIVAVLAFGGIWGVWGVFFAIPLATLIKAIYKAWPRRASDDPEERRASDDSGEGRASDDPGKEQPEIIEAS
ncbi:MAG: AI-2E family transporter, partial [Pseudomonadales bacterium]|nr:AI-2E family transporter [Pseudomonadales bacterium]